MDAARNFLEAALKGDYKEASIYMLRDSTNIGYLEATERNYRHMNPDEKRNLRQASLRFFDSNKINDSTTITIFDFGVALLPLEFRLNPIATEEPFVTEISAVYSDPSLADQTPPPKA